MTVHSLGYLYVATRLGIQVCDQLGRVVAIINPRATGPVPGVAYGDKLYRRHLLRKGILPWSRRNRRFPSSDVAAEQNQI